MTTNTIELFDVVVLTVDLPEYNLWLGQVGAVVETLVNGATFEVEFSDRNGCLIPVLQRFALQTCHPGLLNQL